jgi:H+/Cl- antiporter ClcA
VRRIDRSSRPHSARGRGAHQFRGSLHYSWGPASSAPRADPFAGVAAAFNTPLAGVVFAIEELSRSFEERASGTTLTAVVLAGVTAIALVGNYDYFGQPHLGNSLGLISPSVIAVALAGGLAGGLFSRLTLLCVSGLPELLGRFQRSHPAWFALGCGVVLAGIGWVSGGRTYGTGYVEARMILEYNIQLPWSYARARRPP